MMIENVIQFAIMGAIIGTIYGTAAVGLTIIWGIVKIINFAQAEFMMLAMYLSYYLYQSVGLDPLLLTVIPVFLLMFVMGFVVERLIISHVIYKTEMSHFIYTCGLMWILTNLALLLFGATPRAMSIPASSEAINFLFLSLNKAQLTGCIICIIVVLIVITFFKKSEIGWLMRASAEDKDLVSLLGVDTHKIYALAWAVGIGITAIAGVFIATYYPITPAVGSTFVLVIFVITVLGGLGDIKGAFVGGIIIGVVQNLTIVFLPVIFSNVVAYSLFIIVLIVRPGGILARRTRR